jgi:hypothetical protein
MRRARGHGAERNGDGRKVQGMYFPRFGCLILHQRNTERSGTEMEERSRECIFQGSVALFYISVTRSGAERRWKKGPGNVFSKVDSQSRIKMLCTHKECEVSPLNFGLLGPTQVHPKGDFTAQVALFYISVTRSGAERRWKKGPHGAERNGDGRKVQGMYFPRFGCLILHQRNTERSGTEMEERSTRSGAERRWKKGPGNVFSNVRLPYSTSA